MVDAVLLIQLKPECIVNGMGECLFCAEITFGGLDGGMAEWELDVFELAAGFAAELGAGAAEIMGSELAEFGLAGVANN